VILARTTLREITVECASSSLEARNRQNVSKKNVSRSDRFFCLVRRFAAREQKVEKRRLGAMIAEKAS
jgi:hypothetical protein